MNRCEAWSTFRTCLDDSEEFRIELRTFACIWNQSELRTFECMSAFEVIQECEHLNASGIVCIESVYEFKEPGMEFPETHRIFQRKLRSVSFTFMGNFHRKFPHCDEPI